MTARHAPTILADVEEDSLITCTICLRVRRGTDWIESEQAIRDLRTFACPLPPRLESALCDQCVESIRRRRAGAQEPLAA
jgi:hypothetical protein